ncbi:MAG: hypothetical protein ABID38_01090 [Candidatus Diapherotrites archaeon]
MRKPRKPSTPTPDGKMVKGEQMEKRLGDRRQIETWTKEHPLPKEIYGRRNPPLSYAIVNGAGKNRKVIDLRESEHGEPYPYKEGLKVVKGRRDGLVKRVIKRVMKTNSKYPFLNGKVITSEDAGPRLATTRRERGERRIKK